MLCIGGSRGGGERRLLPPFQFLKREERKKTKQKIEDNPLEKEEDRKSCMFVFQNFPSQPPPPSKNVLIRACYV